MTSGTMADADDRSLAARVAGEMRQRLTAGDFAPGEKLSEQAVADQFGISRNTLREVFRLLTSQGLLLHIPNRGVFVAAPDEAAVLDIYRMRAVIQRGAVRVSSPSHPAIGRMRTISDESEQAARADDWQRVGTLNMAFHRAMVELCDSPRLNAAFELVLAELRLVFGRLDDTAHLHAPYITLNRQLVALLEAGDGDGAAAALDAYLLQSERAVLAALQRR